jgi:folylpolyglutamate synthase/dihydropteroate synthase
VFGRQRDEGRKVLVREAARLGITPLMAGEDFDGRAEDGRLVYQDEAGLLDLPPPALAGPHQFDNAALAIAAARHFGLPVTRQRSPSGLRNVQWPARLSRCAAPCSRSCPKAPNSGSTAATTPMAPPPSQAGPARDAGRAARCRWC